MMLKFLTIGFVAVLLNVSASWAEAPRVVTDIPPVHSLVSRVMHGVGTPGLLVRTGASAHSHALRPSDAEILEQADLVIWIGPELTPWLEKPIGVLAGSADTVELLEAEGTKTLSFRESEAFEVAEDDDHDGGEHDEHDHAHDGVDPHAWLDPENATFWLELIGSKLAELDPENAEAYLLNAEQSKSEIKKLVSEIERDLIPVVGARFIVFHDAYQYFESRFGLSAAGAIALGDASDPGPARIAAVRELVWDANVKCILSEPLARDGLVQTVVDGSGARIATVDPAGAGLNHGPDLYLELLRSLTSELKDCMS